jgi:hypothetical protein
MHDVENMSVEMNYAICRANLLSFRVVPDANGCVFWDDAVQLELSFKQVRAFVSGIHVIYPLFSLNATEYKDQEDRREAPAYFS